MSELEKIIKRRHFPVRVKLSAVRDRLIEELDFSEVLIKYNVCSSTFQGWLNKYKSRVLSEESYKRLSLPVDNPKTLLSMTDKERQELERLREEVEKQKVLVEAYELMLELAKSRLHVDVKKLRGDAISGIGERQKAREGKTMTEFLCNSLGYSKQAYYKSLRSSNEGEERERYVLSIVEEIRRDMPRLGVLKLWKMLNDNGLEVGRDWLFVYFTVIT